MKTEQYKETKEELAGWPVRVVSYKLGTTYYVSVKNEQPGAWFVKEQGPELAEVEARARKKASEMLAKTRKQGIVS